MGEEKETFFTYSATHTIIRKIVMRTRQLAVCAVVIAMVTMGFGSSAFAKVKTLVATQINTEVNTLKIAGGDIKVNNVELRGGANTVVATQINTEVNTLKIAGGDIKVNNLELTGDAGTVVATQINTEVNSLKISGGDIKENNIEVD